MRLIDADALRELLAFDELCEAIVNSMPTVCCAGCRYWKEIPLSEAYGHCDIAPEDRPVMTPADFGCAYFDIG